jgi:hypothetical protein
VEQPAKKSKKYLVGVYGRLVVLALMVLGFFGPWFKIASCTRSSGETPPPTIYSGADVYSQALTSGPLVVIPIAAGLLCLVTLLRAALGRFGRIPFLVILERLAAGLTPLCFAFMIVLVLGAQWGLQVTIGGVYLAPINLLVELGLTKPKEKRWPVWGWLLVVAILLVPVGILVVWLYNIIKGQ